MLWLYDLIRVAFMITHMAQTQEAEQTELDYSPPSHTESSLAHTHFFIFFIFTILSTFY